MTVKKAKVIDLFSGVGGLSLGAALAGFELTAAVEIDPHALYAHSTNFPRTVHIAKSVSEIGKEILDDLSVKKGELSGLIGGPPCQGFSYIGKRNIDDLRNCLFSEFFRIVSLFRPKFFLAENVPGILCDKYAQVRDSAFSHVEKDYTILPPIVASAHEYGAPTTRTRVVFIGFLKNEMPTLSETLFLPSSDAAHVRVKQALTGLPREIDPEWQTQEDGWQKLSGRIQGTYPQKINDRIPHGVGNEYAIKQLKNYRRISGCFGTRHSEEILRRFAEIRPGEKDKISKSVRLVEDGFCPTLRAGTGKEHGSFQAVRPLHPTENRVITPREAARLQGFPDWFQFSPTKWHSFRQIGNSVSPILAEYFLSVLYDNFHK